MPKGIREWIALGPYWTCTKNNQTKITFRSNILQKKARVFVVICQATINNTIQGVGTSVKSGFYGCVSENEMLWQILSSKLEVIDQKSSKVQKASHFGWNRGKTRKFRTEAKMDRLQSIIAARWGDGEGLEKFNLAVCVKRPSWTP